MMPQEAIDALLGELQSGGTQASGVNLANADETEEDIKA